MDKTQWSTILRCWKIGGLPTAPIFRGLNEFVLIFKALFPAKRFWTSGKFQKSNGTVFAPRKQRNRPQKWWIFQVRNLSSFKGAHHFQMPCSFSGVPFFFCFFGRGGWKWRPSRDRHVLETDFWEFGSVAVWKLVPHWKHENTFPDNSKFAPENRQTPKMES